ncbi:MAG TPA: hypothetical protein DCQ04_04200 [Actinobacteria bacterium]|nr:hypothetical protein [Actinomycetota bacterium]
MGRVACPRCGSPGLLFLVLRSSKNADQEVVSQRFVDAAEGDGIVPLGCRIAERRVHVAVKSPVTH